VVVLDSQSSDETTRLAHNAGFEVVQVERRHFNHGGTRRAGVQRLLADTDLLVCMTQDAVLADSSALANLLEAFDDPRVGAAYGRQLPASDATAIAAHARRFNYPEVSGGVTLQDRERLGIKTCFLSNSFAAYRVSDLLAVGNFPERVILGEDACVAGRMLLAGKAIAYRADACVVHSHNYSLGEDFQRYFDTGVFHARERWLLDAFGSASGEGLRFVRSELSHLLRRAPWRIPEALVRTAVKWLGYRLGRMERRIPVAVKRRLSMFHAFWLAECRSD
jgi:rhamnosyltransferase